jgi:hypothetical protein
MARASTGLLTLAAVLSFAFVGSASGAKPKPWQWTPAQAGSSLVKWNPIPFPPKSSSLQVKTARCVGLGKAVQRRYSAFRCVTDYDNRFGTAAKRVKLWMSVRRVGSGQPCVSLRSLASVAAGCLSASGAPRTPGTLIDGLMGLRRAMTTRMGTQGVWSSSIDCLSFGAGFFVCTFDNPAERGEAEVTLTTQGPTAKVTKIECLVQTERPGCVPD